MKPLPFKMHTDSEIAKYRRDTFWAKEPETIAWIDSMAAPNSILIDVGANIGVYSLYAASRGILTIAIEPMYQNFHELCRNIILNRFANIVPMFSVASDIHGVQSISIPDDRAGATGTQMNGTYDSKHLIPSVRLDRLIRTLQGKINVKIDIDGQEMKVLQGMGAELQRVESMLIEVEHTNTDSKVLDAILAERGLFRDQQIMSMPNHSSVRRGGNPENIIYWRGDGSGQCN